MSISKVNKIIPTLSLSSLDLVSSSSRVRMSWFSSSFSLFRVKA